MMISRANKQEWNENNGELCPRDKQECDTLTALMQAMNTYIVNCMQECKLTKKTNRGKNIKKCRLEATSIDVPPPPKCRLICQQLKAAQHICLRKKHYLQGQQGWIKLTGPPSCQDIHLGFPLR